MDKTILKKNVESINSIQTIGTKENRNIVMFRNPFIIDSLKSMFSSWENNTGNQIFTESILKNIGPKELVWEEYIQEPFPIEAVITTNLIWITERSDFEYICHQAESLKVPIIPLGVGIQTGFSNTDFKLNKSVQYTLELLQERAVLGVRGENTAHILEKHGIKNFEIIGCPSVYYNGSLGYNIKKKNLRNEKVACNFRSFWGSMNANEKRFLSYCVTKKCSFIEQTPIRFDLSSCNYDVEYYNYVSQWYKANENIFFSVAAWKKYMRNYEFCMGARFHGNVVAIWENVPALFLTIDARTQEMVDYFKFPYIKLDEFDWEKPLGYYYDLADYSEFDKIYQKRYKNYVNFLERNGIILQDKDVK